MNFVQRGFFACVRASAANKARIVEIYTVKMFRATTGIRREIGRFSRHGCVMHQCVLRAPESVHVILITKTASLLPGLRFAWPRTNAHTVRARARISYIIIIKLLHGGNSFLNEIRSTRSAPHVWAAHIPYSPVPHTRHRPQYLLAR